MSRSQEPRSPGRRRFLGAAGGSLAPLLLDGLSVSAQQPSPKPQGMTVEFAWPQYLILHANLRVMASSRDAAPEPYAEAVEAYRLQQSRVPGRAIWYTMEYYIAKATTPEALLGQLTNVFPLNFRNLHVEPTGRAVAEAVLNSMPAFEKTEWPAITKRRKEVVEPILAGSFKPYREKLLAFVLTSLNASAVRLPRVEIQLLDEYLLTGHDVREIQGTYFNVLETRRFPPLGLVETCVMLLARVIELEDRSNSRGALFQLRERQSVLHLPNPALLPRAVLYWTAGEAIRRIVDPAHEHVGRTLRIYERAFRRFLPALTDIWNPYLDGKLSLDEALDGLIARVADT